MKPRPVYCRTHARALLVGVSLLLMACSATAASERRGELPLQTDTPAASQINPVVVEQILTSLTMLQLGYSGEELAAWYERSQQHAAARPVRSAWSTPVHQRLSPSPTAPIWPDADRREQIATALPSLMSGSSPLLLSV